MPKPTKEELPQERIEQLTTWAYEVWTLYWKEFAPVSSCRQDFLTYVLRDNFDDDKLSEIRAAVIEQRKYYQAQHKAGKKLVGVRGLQVWYNKKMYEEMFIEDSFFDLKQQAERKQCAWKNCNEEVLGEKYHECRIHVGKKQDRFRAQKIDVMTRNGLLKQPNETTHNYAMRCRQSALPILKGLLSGKSGMNPVKT